MKEAASGRDTDGILHKNPFRYRCYYYDVETGFYYLNARYYDPQRRRFISADDQLEEIVASVIGYNLYAYCDNSPVGAADYDGHCAIVLIVAGAAISVKKLAEIVAVAALAYMVYDYYKNPNSKQNPVAVIANTISDQVVSIRNAKEKKNGENVGTEDTGEAEKGLDDSRNKKVNEPTSPSQLQRQVEKGQAPKEVDRVDKGRVEENTQNHIHFKDGTAINQDGTVHESSHGTPKLNNRIRK